MDYHSCKEIAGGTRFYGSSAGKRNRMARFVHRAVSSEKVPFALHIDKFSLVVRRGFYEGPLFQSYRSDSQWSLVVYASDGEAYEDFIDIRLRRNESNGRDQVVELKVTIDDYFGLSALSEEGQFCFGSKDTHKVMSVPRKYQSEFNKLRYLPNDTLTVRGEMTVYEEDERPFEGEFDFENSREISNFAACLAIGRWIFWKLLIFLAVATGGCVAVATVYQAIRHAIYNIIRPFLYHVVFPFVIKYAILCAALYWVWCEFRKHQKRKERRYSPKPHGYSANELEVVPFTDGGYKHTKKHSMSGQRVIYVLDDRGYYGRKDRYLSG